MFSGVDLAARPWMYVGGSGDGWVPAPLGWDPPNGPAGTSQAVYLANKAALAAAATGATPDAVGKAARDTLVWYDGIREQQLMIGRALALDAGNDAQPVLNAISVAFVRARAAGGTEVDCYRAARTVFGGMVSAAEAAALDADVSAYVTKMAEDRAPVPVAGVSDVGTSTTLAPATVTVAPAVVAAVVKDVAQATAVQRQNVADAGLMIANHDALVSQAVLQQAGTQENAAEAATAAGNYTAADAANAAAQQIVKTALATAGVSSHSRKSLLVVLGVGALLLALAKRGRR